MTYTIFIKKQARKMLQSLPRPDRNRITEKIVLLGRDPDDQALNVKKLQEQPYFRLRVGQWRVIFDRNDEIKIIEIEKIKSRGGACK